MAERLLIVGLGSIGQRHLRIARELLPHAQIAALRRPESDPSPVPGVDHIVTSLDEAVDFNPQAAVVASPATYHLGTATRLAQSGAHLLIEKPIASGTTGVAELIETCRSGGLTLMTGYNLRFLPSLEELRELVIAGRVGRVLSVRAEVGQYLPAWRPGSDYRETASAQASLGGGVLLELSHEIDYLRWLFGEVAWVSAIQRRQSDLEIDVEDTAHLILGFADGGTRRPVLAALSMDFVRHDATRCCSIIGESGSLRWTAAAGTVDVFEPGAENWRTLFEQPVAKDDSYRAEWANFLDSIAGRAAPRASGEDGLAALEVVEAARASADAGCVTPVRSRAVRHLDA